MGKLNELVNDKMFMDASPDDKKTAVLGVVNKALTEKHGNALSDINFLPQEEQDAIYTGLANEITPTFKGTISVTKDDLKGLDGFRDKRTYLEADKRNIAQRAFDESLNTINSTGQAFSNIGDGIVQGLTGYDPNIANALHIGEARDDYGWLQDASAVPTGLVAGGLLGLAGSVAPWALPSWYGATQGVMANQENDKAREEALKTGDWEQYSNLTKNKALAVGLNAGAGVATSFIPATLGKGLAKKALTGAVLGYGQDAVSEKAMEYARTGKVTASVPSVGLGTVMGGGFPLAGAGFKHILDRKAGKGVKNPHVEVPPEQIQQTKQAIQTDLQSPDINVRLKARHADLRLRRYEAQAKSKTTAFNTKSGAKVPDNVPDNVPHSAEVAKPANVEAPTTKESLTVEPNPQETAVEAKVVEPTPAKVEKVPERPDGMTHKEHLDYLNKKAPAGYAYESQAYDKGYLALYEKTSHAEAKVIAEKELSDKPISQLSDTELIKKAEKRASEVETDSSDPVNVAKNNILLKELDNRRFNAEGDTPELDKAHEALTLATSRRATKSGKEISGLETKTSVERATEVLREYSKESPAKLKADAEAVKAEAKTVTEDELKAPKAINKGTRDIDTQLQDLKASQGTQPQTPDDIRRGAGVLMGHDSFLAKETLEALGYPLKYKKFSGNANSTGWSVLIGGKKIELHPNDSLGGLLRRNKLEGAFEAGLVKRKAGDVVKGLIDDFRMDNSLTNDVSNSDGIAYKVQEYASGLPQGGNLLTSREAEAFTLLDNAKTPEELNAVEAYVSKHEDKYQDGFHDDFYRQWNERHQAIEDGYTAGIKNRVAKADDTRQLKATEELKVLKKQLEAETNKVLKLENEMALLSPTVRLERTLQNDVLRDAKKVAKRLKGGYESGKIDDAQFTRIVEGLSPETREALAEEFSC